MRLLSCWNHELGPWLKHSTLILGLVALKLGGQCSATNCAAGRRGKVGSVPTVLRFDGLRVVIYPNDHRPTHVHVMGSESEAVFNLNCPRGPVELRENYDFSRRETRKIANILTEHVTEPCRAWEEIHRVA
jgi:hypothetical protein